MKLDMGMFFSCLEFLKNRMDMEVRMIAAYREDDMPDVMNTIRRFLWKNG